jgi:hypothetical protein
MEITLHCDRLRRGADEWMDVTDALVHEVVGIDSRLVRVG